MSPTVAVRAIRNDADMDAAMKRLREIWEPEPGTPEADEAEILTILIQAYDKEHHPVPSSDDPIQSVITRMDDLGQDVEQMALLFGSRETAQEVLERRRPLTIEMVRNLHRQLGIPLEDLIGA